LVEGFENASLRRKAEEAEDWSATRWRSQVNNLK
jgi:hypothetical protein